jgi:folate-binding protein YgfZ
VFRSKVQNNHQHSVNVYLSNTANRSQDSALSPGTIEERGTNTIRARLANPSTVYLTLTSETIASEKDVECNDSVQSPESFWTHQMHASSIPELTLEQSEKHLPEPLNLDLSGAISFDKGCYTGQEVIARMHYLGKAKKRLFQFTTIESATIDSGMPVFDQRGNNIGEVFSVTSTSKIAKEHRDTEANIVMTEETGGGNEVSLIGLAILTTPSVDSKHDSESNQCWVNQAPNEPHSIPIETSFPRY